MENELYAVFSVWYWQPGCTMNRDIIATLEAWKKALLICKGMAPIELAEEVNSSDAISDHLPQRPSASLAKVDQLYSDKFVFFMICCNLFAYENGLRVFTNWSKVWEYPWLWYNGLEQLDWKGKRLLDLGSEISPMPWFIATLGARVDLLETDPQWIPIWQALKEKLSVDVNWSFVEDESIPHPDASFDVVTSFSVIEHQLNQAKAIDEVSRALKPRGLFALSFDICEPTMGMTFPAWNGTALTTADFETLIWDHPAFDAGGTRPKWNLEDSAEFIRWNLRAASHHNYTVGAAILRKKAAP